MKWKDLLEKLMQENRYSVYDLANKAGIEHTSLYRLLSEQTKRPSERTIKKLEEVFNVKIYGKEDVMIEKRDTAFPEAKSLKRIPLIKTIYRRLALIDIESITVGEVNSLTDSASVFALEAKDKSLAPLINDKTIIVFDTEALYSNDDIVIAKTRTDDILIRRYKKVSDKEVLFYV